ncbi:hypothetical protein ACFW9D_24075 [Streptomyces sp. NPDC059524]
MSEKRAPVVDVRIGGFRMTWQCVPVRFVTLLATGAGSALTAWWTTR